MPARGKDVGPVMEVAMVMVVVLAMVVMGRGTALLPRAEHNSLDVCVQAEFHPLLRPHAGITALPPRAPHVQCRSTNIHLVVVAMVAMLGPSGLSGRSGNDD